MLLNNIDALIHNILFFVRATQQEVLTWITEEYCMLVAHVTSEP